MVRALRRAYKVACAPTRAAEAERTVATVKVFMLTSFFVEMYGEPGVVAVETSVMNESAQAILLSMIDGGWSSGAKMVAGDL